MRIERRHNLGKEEARRRIQKLLDRWNEKGVQHSWDGDIATIGGSVLGIKFGATIHVSDDLVWCEGKDPPWVVRKKALEYIERKMKESFDE